MKKGLLTTLLILVLATGASAGPAIYAGGGVSMPMGPEFFKDNWKMGIGFGGGVGFAVNPQFEVVGKVFYNTFAMDVEGIEGGDFVAFAFGADVHFYPMANETNESAFSPYILGGIGMTSAKLTEITAPALLAMAETDAEMDITFGFGAGFEYEMSPKMAFWVEGKFTIISTEGESTSHLPIRAGLKFNLGE